jgi:colicin import membrane protein
LKSSVAIVGFLSNYIVPTLFTGLLHLLVILTVLVGWQLTDTHRFRVETPRYVKAQLVTLEQKQKKPEAEAAVPLPAMKTVPAPSEPVEEELAPPAKAESKVETKAIAKPIAEPRPDPEIELQKAREQEQQRRRQIEQELEQELEQQRVQQQRAQQEVRQRQQQQALQRAMQEEEMMMQAEQDAMLADSYAALIKRTVEGYWSRPASARKNMQVELAIRLVPTGDVVGVEVIRSSGNTSFDRSAVLAVKKAGRFPELKDMPSNVFEEYFRSFTLVFKPEDLLL